MQAPIAHTAPRTDVPAQQAPQAPLPLDQDALRHVFGGGPGGSWNDDTGG